MDATTKVSLLATGYDQVAGQLDCWHEVKLKVSICHEANLRLQSSQKLQRKN
jgi:hypothetical protein